MGDPLSIATGILTVAGLTFKSVSALHGAIRSLQSQNRDARALKAEVGDLTGVLSSLLDTITNNPELDFRALEQPLQRCGKACEEYNEIISRCTKRSDGTSRSSLRDWITQKYLQGDINDFRNMLAAHKSTISIALANANLRIAAISPGVLEEYKDMVFDTTTDLNAHLTDLQEKIDRLKNGESEAIDDVAMEWQAMLEETQSTQQGLNMCAQLSAQITHFESASSEHAQFSERPSARKHIKVGLSETRKSIQSLVTRLQAHEAKISSQMEAMSLQDAISEPVVAQLARLQQAKESITQCIHIVSEASELANERSNVFEDLTLADNSYALSVSTVQDLVTARRLNLSGRSRHVGGQVTNATVQQTIKALTQLDAEHLRLSKSAEGHRQISSGTRASTLMQDDVTRFHDRYGPGSLLMTNKLSEQNT